MRIGLKLALVGLLMLLLLVPLGLLGGLVSERQQRGLEVAAEIAQSSSGPQDVVGPLLLVETERLVQRKRVVSRDGVLREEIEDRRERQLHLVAPETLAIDNQLRSERRGRSLFSVPLYHDSLQLRGQFRLPATTPDSPARPRRLWLVLGLGDNRGLRQVRIDVAGRTLAAEPGTRVGWLPDGLNVVLPAEALGETALPFTIALDLTGTTALSWLPIGGETTVTARSDWPHPGFVGRHLPATSQVGASGFEARWAVSRLASKAQQAVLACAVEADGCDGLAGTGFGVRLVDPVDRYLMTERAMKYALLFLALVFGAVFLVEVLAGRPVHPLQYGLTGLALAMFYLLLLSLSEHIGFGPAYALAAAACTALLGYYLAGALGSRRRGLGFGAGLAGLYGLLYTLLQSEDYALLVGALVLFALLAAVMALTRRIDWNRIGVPAG